MVSNIVLLQIKALIWKNIAVRKHEYILTIFHTLLPSVLIIIFAYSNAAATKTYDQRFNNDFKVYYAPNNKHTSEVMINVKSLISLKDITGFSTIAHLNANITRGGNGKIKIITITFRNLTAPENNFEIRHFSNFKHFENNTNSSIATLQAALKSYRTVSLNFYAEYVMYGFAFILPFILERLVEEKKSGIKELMKLMGLNQWTIWFGYFIDIFIFGTISTLLNVYFLTNRVKQSSKPLLTHSNGFSLFFFLISYLISFISFAFVLSTLFNNATCASVIGFFVCIMTLTIPQNIIKQNKSLSYKRKLLFSLLPNTALYFGFEQIHLYESAGIDINWSVAKEEGISLNIVVVMFFVDTIMYLLLSMYIENIMPGPYGVAKPTNFPCKYFLKDDSTDIDDDITETTVSKFFKIDAPPNLPVGIRIKNLRKKFGTIVAVNNFSIDIYRGEITVLLGHNGAGKTTLMSIITGMISPSRGSVFVNGRSIKFCMTEIRQSLGLCMQNNLHFPQLTVVEHLVFFGMIKGLSNKKAYAEANSFINKVKMTHRKNSVSSKLSGGMKRKLSLGIALCGNPEVLILDEPSSGLDPESRREIWNVLLSCRGVRTVVVTTHFMEEADVLGDRIAIMHNGQLICFGSPFYLKKEFGSGYHLVLICNKISDKTNEITDVIKKTIPKAVLQTSSGSSLTFLLPQDSKSSFGKLFDDIEKNKSNLNIVGISLSITTLEEVFLRVDQLVNATINEQDLLSPWQTSAGLEALRKKPRVNITKKGGLLKRKLAVFCSLLKKRRTVALRSWHFLMGQLLTVILITLLCLRVGNPSLNNPVGQEQIWNSIFSIGLLIVTGSFLFFPQKETASNAKQLQLMCGVSCTEYWLVLVCWDVFFFLVTTLCIFMTIYCYSFFERNIFQDNLEKETLFVILMTYLCPMLPFTYLFSYCKTASRGFTMLLVCSIFVGSIMQLLGNLMAFLLGSEEIVDAWNTYVDFLFPQICFSRILLQFSEAALANWKSKYSKNLSYVKSSSYIFDKKISVKLLLLLKSAVFYTIIFALTNCNLVYLWREKLVIMYYRCLSRTCKKNVVVPCIKDDDVLNEEERIMNTFKIEKKQPKEMLNSYLTKKDTDLILVSDIRKIYNGRNVVNGISFAVKPGECFGLLGVNGAGKTTTFRMLTGDQPIATGDVRIYTKERFLYISKNSKKFLERVGYCPQVDAIIPALTGRELLHLMAELRGLYINQNKEVEIWINALGLERYADRLCGTYSGGNKRKLGIAVALIGDPIVVFLDEPTSGVDPLSRRKVWDTVDAIQQGEIKPSIILTSHSMEECEILCNTLGIMKTGQLACYGEIPKLKEKYVLGFVVFLKLKIIFTGDDSIQPTTSKTSDDSKELKVLMKTFENNYKENCRITDKHEGLLQYRITDKNKTWSTLFNEIEQIKDQQKIIEDYSITETSLEEIFLAIARS